MRLSFRRYHSRQVRRRMNVGDTRRFHDTDPPIGHPARSFGRSIPGHAHEIDARDFALGIEADKKAGRIAAREDELHQIKCLVCYRAVLQDFGARRRGTVQIDLAGHPPYRIIGQLGTVCSGQLRAIEFARLHLFVPPQRKSLDVVRRRRVGERQHTTARQQRRDQHQCHQSPHQRGSSFKRGAAEVAPLSEGGSDQPPPPPWALNPGESFSKGSGLSGCCKSGTKSLEAPPGKRLIFGYFMIDLSKSTITGSSSDNAQPLSWPEYLPRDDVSVRAGAAPLKVM